MHQEKYNSRTMDKHCKTQNIKYFLSTNKGVKKLTNFCRGCLKKREEMRFLLDNTEETNMLIAKFATILNLDVELESKLPSYFCKICEKKVNSFFDFMEQCKITNDLIHQYFETLRTHVEPCKTETADWEVESPNGINAAHIGEDYNYTEKHEREYSEDEISAKRYICCHCNKSYRDMERLQAHMLQHDEEEHQDVDVKVENSALEMDSNENLSTDDDEEDDKTTNIQDEFELFKSEEVPKSYNQKMRLEQYKFEEVDRVIKMVRKKLSGHTTCTFCQFQATSTRTLSAHITKMHRKFKGQWCLRCNELFDDLAGHKKTVHAEDLKCPFCNRIQYNLSSFMEHMVSHSGTRLHKCTICSKAFVLSRHLKNHQMTHVDGRVMGCRICKKRFLQMKNLRRHIRLVHKRSIEPQNYCQKCDKKVRSLPQHNNKHHSLKPVVREEKQSLCPHCGKQFNTQSKLTHHLRTHTGEMPYKCKYCEKRLRTRSGLTLHERTHTGEKPYTCSICGKSFSQSSVLNTHLRIHTGRPEQCTICKKRFCRPAELRLHLRKHTGEKPYICDICHRAFKQKSHLMEHAKRHSVDRPYKCNFCEKAFKKFGSLRCHLQIHTGDKPFKCSQCSYACRQPYSLTQHMQQHENDKPRTDYPYTCKLCQKKFSTVAHLTTHYNRFHPYVKIKLVKKKSPSKPPSDQMHVPDEQFFPEDIVAEEQVETTTIQNDLDESLFEFTVI